MNGRVFYQPDGYYAILIKVLKSSTTLLMFNSLSGYVNVCAAVCLLLLVGGLSPQSSAAPHRSRIMERQRRANGENRLWANPCDYNDSNVSK